MRPLPDDHPNFPNKDEFNATMGLPDELDLATGLPAGQELPQMIWDVDNDGDGIPDSIWIDIGLPIQTDASGRRYRPLVAILCQDLDGRLNLNAHSSAAHYQDLNDPPSSYLYADRSGWPLSSTTLRPIPSHGRVRPFASTPYIPEDTKLVPRGLGYGPADIFLGHLLGFDATAGTDDFRRVLSVRYGIRDILTSSFAAGIFDQDDLLSQIKNVGLPRRFSDSNNPSAYGSQPDVSARGGIGLDHTGQPMAVYMGLGDETVSDPYELVLNRKSAGYHDQPFTLAELERVLRYDDIDAYGLPDRLLNAASTTFGENATLSPAELDFVRSNRRRVTTHSSHLSVTSGSLPMKMQGFRSGTILDLYRERIMRPLIVTGTPQPQAFAFAMQEMKKIVPWEILHGERFNINRLLGNGQNDPHPRDLFGAVDDPAEALLPELIWPNVPAYSGVRFNYLNDDPVLSVYGPSSNRFAPKFMRDTFIA